MAAAMAEQDILAWLNLQEPTNRYKIFILRDKKSLQKHVSMLRAK